MSVVVFSVTCLQSNLKLGDRYFSYVLLFLSYTYYLLLISVAVITDFCHDNKKKKMRKFANFHLLI